MSNREYPPIGPYFSTDDGSFDNLAMEVYDLYGDHRPFNADTSIITNLNAIAPPFCHFDQDIETEEWGFYPKVAAAELAEEDGDIVMLADALLEDDEVPPQFLRDGIKVMVYSAGLAQSYYEDGELVWEV